jgi:hypothetical protein
MRRRKRRDLGAVSKQDFQAIGEILCHQGAAPSMTAAFARYFQGQNPRFDAARFSAFVAKCQRR